MMYSNEKSLLHIKAGQKMDDEQDRDKHKDKQAAPRSRRRGVFYVWLGGGFLVALTIFVFVVLCLFNGFVERSIESEYAVQTQNAVDDIVRRFRRYEDTLGALSVVADRDDSGVFFEEYTEIKKLIPDIKIFDYVVYIYPTFDINNRELGWGHRRLYGREGPERYNVLLKEYFDDNYLDFKLIKNDQYTVFTDVPFVVNQRGRPSSYIKQYPFMLVRSLGGEGGRQGYIVGVTRAAHVLRPVWAGQNHSLARLAVRDRAKDVSIYGFDRRAVQGDRVTRPVHIYEFTMAGQIWEMSLQFFVGDKVSWLKYGIWGAGIVFSFLVFVCLGLFFWAVRSRQFEIGFHNHIQILKEECLSKNEGLVRCEERLAQTKNMTDLKLSMTGDVFFALNEKAQFTEMHVNWLSLTEISAEQVLGRDLKEFFQKDDHIILREAMAALNAGNEQKVQIDTKVKTRGGQYRDVVLKLMVCETGHVKGDTAILGLLHDVEEVSRLHHALKDAQKQYDSVLESAVGGVFRLASDGDYISVNGVMARMMGYGTPDDFIKSCTSSDVYANQSQRQTFMRTLEQRNVINNYETQVKTRNGDILWVNENIRCVYDSHGKLQYYEGSLTDITAYKTMDVEVQNAQIELDLANRAKSEFLANMSHELRTPLNAIIGFSEIIKNESFGPLNSKPYLEYAQDIHESGTKLMNIINEILDISKIEAGERTLNEGQVDVESVVNSCIKLLSNKAIEHEVTVKNTIEKGAVLVADELSVKQIIINLLSNAIKFTPAKGLVTISANTGVNGEFRLLVNDTGIGLDEHETQKALSPFGQIGNDLSRSNTGTGLGLTLVDGLIKLHGGSVEIFSQKGMGTTVTVIFPASRVFSG